MKRILLAVAVLALVFPALRQAEARTNISIDFFYENLGDGGNWIEAGDYGYCWQPTVAVSNRSWRPYSDGYWAYTDVGWTWVSYEDFGWATYHYGRWMRLRGRGWVWVPGREWAPAWVSWRTGGDYVGWAPLPPRRAGDIYVDFSPINSRVDIDFDIGPAYYNFIDVRYIGEPVLRERIFAADRNMTYVSQTVNVTNITYTNSTVYNYGPDYNTLSRYSTRPIQKLTLQRDANVDPLAAAQSKSLMKVQGDKLVIAAPQQFQKPTQAIAPKVVKEKVVMAQAPVERGWEPAGDQKAQTELKEKMKKEDPKSIPPPTVQASEKAGTSPAATAPGTTTASATPSTTASPAAAASPSAAPANDKDKGKDRDKDKNKAPENVSPAPSASSSVNPAMTPAKNKNKQNDKVPPLAPPSVSAPPAMTPASAPDRGKNKQRENVAPSASVPPATGATETTAPTLAPKPPKQKPEKPKNESAVPPATGVTETTAPTVAPRPPKQKPEKPKNEFAVPPPLDAAPKSAPRVAPPPTPETKHKQPGPDVTKPEAAVEKPKQPPSDIPKPKKEQAPPERMAPPPPSANVPVNPPPERMAPPPPSANVPVNPPPARDEGKKKDKDKNLPATSPTP